MKSVSDKVDSLTEEIFLALFTDGAPAFESREYAKKYSEEILKEGALTQEGMIELKALRGSLSDTLLSKISAVISKYSLTFAEIVKMVDIDEDITELNRDRGFSAVRAFEHYIEDNPLVPLTDEEKGYYDILVSGIYIEAPVQEQLAVTNMNIGLELASRESRKINNRLILDDSYVRRFRRQIGQRFWRDGDI